MSWDFLQISIFGRRLLYPTGHKFIYGPIMDLLFIEAEMMQEGDLECNCTIRKIIKD